MEEKNFNNDTEEIFVYLNKYGLIYPEDKSFNHKRELGEKCIQFKPEKIIIWLGEKNKDNILAGIEITYRNIMDGTKIEFKNSLGEKTKDKYIFIIKPTEYLINFKIWLGDDSINKVYFLTNKGNEFSVGNTKGIEMKIDEFNKSQIILFFFGNYNKYLTSLAPIIITREKYLKILFQGYYLLKAFLRKKEKREKILEKMKNGEYSNDDVALIKTCLLSDNPFNGIIKFCIV